MKLLVTPRLILRPLELSDLPSLIELYRDAEVVQFLAATADAEAIERQLQKRLDQFDRRGFGMYAAIDRREKRFDGIAGLDAIATTSVAELSVVLRKEAWNKGYATEASKELMRAAFNEWQLSQIYAATNPKHRSAIHLLKKLGMRYERGESISETERVIYGISATNLQPSKRPLPPAGNFISSPGT